MFACIMVKVSLKGILLPHQKFSPSCNRTTSRGPSQVSQRKVSWFMGRELERVFKISARSLFLLLICRHVEGTRAEEPIESYSTANQLSSPYEDQDECLGLGMEGTSQSSRSRRSRGKVLRHASQRAAGGACSSCRGGGGGGGGDGSGSSSGLPFAQLTTYPRSGNLNVASGVGWRAAGGRKPACVFRCSSWGPPPGLRAIHNSGAFLGPGASQPPDAGMLSKARRMSLWVSPLLLVVMLDGG